MEVARRRARSALGLAALLTAALPCASSLDLSNQGLTNVTVGSDGASFAFFSDGGAVATADASDLATETELYLQNNSLTSVPAELLSAMTAATVVDLSYNPLTKIETGSFDGLPLLQEIKCTDTELRTVSSKAIANCPKLQEVYLSGGNLTVLYSDSFYNLSKIHTLDLSANTLPTVPSSLFALSDSWKALNFSNNVLTTVPTGVQNIVAEGFVSFNWNLLVEIDAYAFAGADISELYIASNAIFTVNSEAFSGMSSLKTLDLSDNTISVIDKDAFEGLDNLAQLRLGRNNLHRLSVTKFPRNLEGLELQENRLDLLPDLPDSFEAPKLSFLNLSNNILWSIGTNSELQPYTGLVTLDLSSNQLRNFTPTVFDPIVSTIEIIHFDDNLITSIPRTTFVSLLQRLLTNVSLSNNPGVGWAYDNETDAQCPNGSVFTQMAMGTSSYATSAMTNLTLYGCIQCKAGTFHDNSTNSCQPCTSVSARAFADEDGATYCSYCPYSSDLDDDRIECHDFECNTYCWFTLSFGISVPGLIFGSKFLLMLIAKTTKRSRRVNFKEREDMNEWRMGLVMHQLGEISPHDALLDDVDPDDEVHSTGAALRIYDFPDETKDMVLETLQEHFELRKQKMRVKLSAHELDEAMEWDDVEWQTFHMHRILSRNYHGEVFLGDYIGSQVVVKRMMTLRFEVRELADAISDIELMLTFRHPQIVQFLGTMWRDPEHLCVISEYVKGGDLGSLLELEAMNARANTSAVGVNDLESSFDLSTSPSESFHVGGGAPGSTGEEYPGERALFNASYYSTTRLQMMLDVCLGLAYAHDLGFQHNDLRSRNVLVTEAFRCKLNDFQHHSRTTKIVGMVAQLTPAALATSTSVIEGDDVIIRSNNSDEDEEDDDVVMMEHTNPEGVRFREPLIKRKVVKDMGPMLPLVAPEVVLAQRRARHWSADIYSVGVLLMEVWCQPFVSFEIGSSGDMEKKRSASTASASADDDNASQEEKTKSQRQQQQQQQRALDTAVKEHSEQLRRFMDKLRAVVLATVNDDASNNSRSFRTTTTTSSSLTSAASPCSPQAVAKVLGAIEECLSGDIKKRPTAKALAKIFQNLLEDTQAH